MARHAFSALAGGMLLLLCGCQTSPEQGRAAGAAQEAASPDRTAKLAQAVADASRTEANRARDPYRHPAETLEFFEVDPDDTVVEIWPGRGWYTEILAPYLRAGNGRLYAATPSWGADSLAGLRQADPQLHGTIQAATFPAFNAGDRRVPDGSADVVLTFRNVHNWRMGYRQDDKQDYSAEAFRQIYAMLKPGGILGVVDHRLPEAASDDRERTSGYIKLSTIRRLAETAGFQLAATSEINANPRDTADWPGGVWTLPPTLALKDQDRERYLAIGESDRMTLKFVKPR